MVSKANILRFPIRKTEERDRMLAALVAEHDSALRRFLRMRQLSLMDQEDVLQDVYLKLARMEDLVERLSQSPDTVRSYLFVMASNVIRDKARRASVRGAGKHQPLEDVEIADTISPEQELAGRQEIGVVERTLREQKAVHRRAFMLSRFEHKSYREIADDLSVSVSTVEKYICRVLLALRQELHR